MAKSFSRASKGVEVRVSAMNPLKQPASGTSALTFNPPSKKLPCGKMFGEPDLGVYGQGEGVFPRLTVAQARSPAGAPSMQSCAV